MLFDDVKCFGNYKGDVPIVVRKVASTFYVQVPMSVVVSELPRASLACIKVTAPVAAMCKVVFFMVYFQLLGGGSTGWWG